MTSLINHLHNIHVTERTLYFNRIHAHIHTRGVVDCEAFQALLNLLSEDFYCPWDKESFLTHVAA